MYNSILIFASLAFVMIGIATPAMAAGKGEGGCIIIAKAKVYANSTGDRELTTGDVGDCIVGANAIGIGAIEYRFSETSGRVSINFFPNAEEKGRYVAGWMNPKDLSTFYYECGCGSTAYDKEQCSPFVLDGLFSGFAYNACYKEARDKKRAEILKSNGGVAATAVPAAGANKTSRAATSTIRNEDIISLVKVGLDDKLIVNKIRSSAATDFDLSTEGLISLKNAKVSNAVIEAMMK